LCMGVYHETKAKAFGYRSVQMQARFLFWRIILLTLEGSSSNKKVGTFLVYRLSYELCKQTLLRHNKITLELRY